MGMGSPTSSELKNALPPEGFVDNEGTASGCTELRDDVAAVELLEQGFGSSDEFAEFARDGQHVGVLPDTPTSQPLSRLVSALRSFSNCQNRIQESRELIAIHQDRAIRSQREINFHTIAIQHSQDAIREEAITLASVEDRLVSLHKIIVSLGFARALQAPEQALLELTSKYARDPSTD